MVVNAPPKMLRPSIVCNHDGLSLYQTGLPVGTQKESYGL